MSKPVTDEQKFWFLLGYFKALSRNLATELEITDDEAEEILLRGLKKKCPKV